MTEMVTKEEWVAALRSGDYNQTTGVLCRVSDNGSKSFCCLGVYMDLLEKRGLAKSNQTNISEQEGFADLVLEYSLKDADGDSEREVLPPGVDRDSFFPTGNPYININDAFYNNTSIAELNDQGTTFEEIADLVENHGLRPIRPTVKEDDL